MLHYHGTPITPARERIKLAGRHFCVSFTDPRDLPWALSHGQSVMLDNGAFSAFTQGKTPDWPAFYEWVAPALGGANWAVVPDVIGGTPEDNMALALAWPHPKDRAAVVWHMDEPTDHMLRLIDLGFGKLAFGSAGRYWQIGSAAWRRRCDTAFNELARRGALPWVHMMRGLALAGGPWPFASADSANVARNYKDAGVCPGQMAERIDAVQSPVQWITAPTQGTMFDEAE